MRDRQSREKREKIRNFINGGTFNSIRTAIKLLTPICNLIVAFQNDKKPISDVYEAFISLNKEFTSISGLTAKDLEAAQDTVNHYWRFIKNPCHLFSNLLDPRYIGKNLGDEKNMVLEQFHERYPDAADELDGFFAYCNTKTGTCIFNGLEKRTTSVIVWWKGQTTT